MSSLVIPKKKEGKVWNETIPCCEADFKKGDIVMKIAKEKNRIRFFKDKEEVLIYSLPETQLEFFILQQQLDGINFR